MNPLRTGYLSSRFDNFFNCRQRETSPFVRLGLGPAAEQADADVGGGRQAPSVRLGLGPAAEQADADVGGGR
jgi:hypothetical protein